MNAVSWPGQLIFCPAKHGRVCYNKLVREAQQRLLFPFCNDQFVCIKGSLHKFIYLFSQILFMSFDDIQIWLRHGMLCHKDSTAVLKGWMEVS